MTAKRTYERAERVWNAAARWRATLDDIHRYIAPWRAPQEHVAPGTPDMDMIFDGTGMRANIQFSQRMVGDVTPAYDTFFALEPGAAITDRAARHEFRVKHEPLPAVVMAALEAGNFWRAGPEMYHDLFAGQGALMVVPGPPGSVLKCVSVPVAEIALELNPWGEVAGIVWRRAWPAEQLPEMWPQGRFSARLKEIIEKEQDKPVTITVYTRHEAQDGVRPWRTVVMAKVDGVEVIHEARERTCMWITPRMFVMPGQAQAVGPAHLALPFVKTVNTAREYALKAAAFAIYGVWAYREDGVFNPDMVQFQPGEFWAVKATGGAYGSTLERIDIPSKFDIAQLVIEDERMQIKQAGFDDQLPAGAKTVRTALEVAERQKKLAMDWAGIDARITGELIRPLVSRALELLHRAGVIDFLPVLNDVYTRMQVLSPIGQARRLSAMEPVLQWLEMLQAMGPELAALAAKVEDIGGDLGEALGVPARFIRSPDEREQMQRQAAMLQAQAMAAQSETGAGAGGAPAAQGGAPALQVVQGGGG